MTTSTQPGWYDDPEDANGQRYWDGQAWTPHRQRKPASQPAPAPSLPPPQPAPASNVAYPPRRRSSPRGSLRVIRRPDRHHNGRAIRS